MVTKILGISVVCAATGGVCVMLTHNRKELFGKTCHNFRLLLDEHSYVGIERHLNGSISFYKIISDVEKYHGSASKSLFDNRFFNTHLKCVENNTVVSNLTKEPLIFSQGMAEIQWKPFYSSSITKSTSFQTKEGIICYTYY